MKRHSGWKLNDKSLFVKYPLNKIIGGYNNEPLFLANLSYHRCRVCKIKGCQWRTQSNFWEFSGTDLLRLENPSSFNQGSVERVVLWLFLNAYNQ